MIIINKFEFPPLKNWIEKVKFVLKTNDLLYLEYKLLLKSFIFNPIRPKGFNIRFMIKG